MNLYEYCWNDPINWTDPYGLFADTGFGPPGDVFDFPGGDIGDIYIPPEIGDILPIPDIPLDLPQIGELHSGESGKGGKDSGSKDKDKPYKKKGDKSKKQEEREKENRKKTIKEHWWKYRHPRDPYEKNDMKKEIRQRIKEFRKRFSDEKIFGIFR